MLEHAIDLNFCYIISCKDKPPIGKLQDFLLHELKVWDAQHFTNKEMCPKFSTISPSQ